MLAKTRRGGPLAGIPSAPISRCTAGDRFFIVVLPFSVLRTCACVLALWGSLATQACDRRDHTQFLVPFGMFVLSLPHRLVMSRLGTLSRPHVAPLQGFRAGRPRARGRAHGLRRARAPEFPATCEIAAGRGHQAMLARAGDAATFRPGTWSSCRRWWVNLYEIAAVAAAAAASPNLIFCAL